MLQVFSGKRGYQTASLDGVVYHSLYNPIIEAERFINDNISLLESGPFLVLGSGLGYLEQEIHKKHPSSKIISIPNDACWTDYLAFSYPFYKCYRHNEPMGSFLARNIYDYELGTVKLIYWTVDPKRNKIFEEEISIFLKKLQASCLTVASFGKRWFKNSFYNYLNVRRTVILPPIENVFIAASGPTLVKSINLLKKYRDKFFLIALPSSIDFLLHHNVKIDMVVSIDGGYYAKLHLLPLDKDVIIATTLLSQTRVDLPHYFFSFNSPIEQLLLPKAPVIRWAGTVAASAIDLALQLTKGDIILAGQDFIDDNLQMHVAPHRFDSTYMTMSYRLEPLVTIFQKFKFSSSLSLYAQWFRSQSWSERVKRLNATEVDISIKQISLTDFDVYKKSEKIVTTEYSEHLPSSLLIEQLFSRWFDLIKNTNFSHKELLMLAFYLDTNQYLKGDMSNLENKIEDLRNYAYKLLASSLNRQ